MNKTRLFGLVLTIFFIIPTIISIGFTLNINTAVNIPNLNSNKENNMNQLENPMIKLNLNLNPIEKYSTIPLIINIINQNDELKNDFPINFLSIINSGGTNPKINFDEVDLKLIETNEKELDPEKLVKFDLSTRKEKRIDWDLSWIWDIIPQSSSSASYIPDPISVNNFISENGLEAILNPESVIPPIDDRARITPTTGFPWITICKLQITAADYTSWMGSGAIIGGRHVLTCGHNVYMHGNGGWVNSILVTPGMDSGVGPIGSAWATNQITTYVGWVDSMMDEHDLAFFTIDSNLGQTTGWMGLRTEDPTSWIYTTTLNTAGYPGDLDSGINMYYDSDIGNTANEYNHWYYMDTAGGQSGSPVWLLTGGERYILTVHAYGDDGSGSNHGTRLNQQKYNDLMFFKNQDLILLMVLFAAAGSSSQQLPLPMPLLLIIIIGAGVGILGLILGIHFSKRKKTL